MIGSLAIIYLDNLISFVVKYQLEGVVASTGGSAPKWRHDSGLRAPGGPAVLERWGQMIERACAGISDPAELFAVSLGFPGGWAPTATRDARRRHGPRTCSAE